MIKKREMLPVGELLSESNNSIENIMSLYHPETHYNLGYRLTPVPRYFIVPMRKEHIKGCMNLMKSDPYMSSAKEKELRIAIDIATNGKRKWDSQRRKSEKIYDTAVDGVGFVIINSEGRVDGFAFGRTEELTIKATGSKRCHAHYGSLRQQIEKLGLYNEQGQEDPSIMFDYNKCELASQVKFWEITRYAPQMPQMLQDTLRNLVLNACPVNHIPLIIIHHTNYRVIASNLKFGYKIVHIGHPSTSDFLSGFVAMIYTNNLVFSDKVDASFNDSKEVKKTNTLKDGASKKPNTYLKKSPQPVPVATANDC